MIGIIRNLLPRIRQYGVVLGLENHDRFPARSLERIIQATDREWVGICLDTSNSLGAGEGIGEIVDVLLPYTVNLHVKDFQVKRVPHKMGFQVSGCALGSGMLDLPYLLQLFKGHAHCKTITLEVWSDPIYHNDPETLGSRVDLAATLAQESAWVEKSIHYLQNCYHKL